MAPSRFIEHFDIYRDCTGTGGPMHSAINLRIRSMRHSKRLEHPEVLLGAVGNIKLRILPPEER